MEDKKIRGSQQSRLAKQGCEEPVGYAIHFILEDKAQ